MGEEYVSIIQVDPTLRRLPSRVRRGALVLLHSLFPYLLDKLLVCLENELEAGEESQGGGIQRATVASPWSPGAWMRGWVRRVLGLLTEPQRRACVPAVLALQQGLSILHRVHVALFYISGAFYHLGKRTAGVSYVGICVRTYSVVYRSKSFCNGKQKQTMSFWTGSGYPSLFQSIFLLDELCFLLQNVVFFTVGMGPWLHVLRVYASHHSLFPWVVSYGYVV